MDNAAAGTPKPWAVVASSWDRDVPDGCPTCGALPCDWTDRPSAASYAAQDLATAMHGILAEADRMTMTRRRRAIFNKGRDAIAKVKGADAANKIGEKS